MDINKKQKLIDKNKKLNELKEISNLNNDENKTPNKKKSNY